MPVLSSTLSHVAYCTQARDRLQVAMCSALQYVIRVHLRCTSRKIMKTSLPFWLFDFCHRKDTDNIEPSKWGCENEAVPAAPAALFRKHRLCICSTPLLKILRGTISSFVVFYSACKHSSTHPRRDFATVH